MTGTPPLAHRLLAELLGYQSADEGEAPPLAPPPAATG
jgi:hypothetical protein